MRIRKLVMATAAALLLTVAGISAHAQEAEPEIYGKKLMTSQEQAQFRERIHVATTDAERNQIRAEHQKQMQARAQKQGVALPDVAARGQGPNADAAQGKAKQVQGKSLMTEEERARHQQEMRLKTDEEREKARKEKHEEMQKRAEKEGVTLRDAPQGGRGMGQGPGSGRGGGPKR
ncbi:MAG: hypothetical protein JRG94_08395 [Deltaproteobacteria bacterium]|nr:hypothetical protein [Deltaproteobacteria bacterium]